MTKNSSRNRRSALRTFTTGDGGRLTPGDGGRRRAGVPLPRGSDGDRTVAATRNVRGAVVGDDGAGAGALLAGRLSGPARASIGHGLWRGGELGGGSGQSYPREMDGDAGSSEVVPVIYDSAVHDEDACRSSSVGWSLPKPRPQSKDSIIGAAPRQPASRLCFATTEWPFRGQQALRQPRICTAVGLSARSSLGRAEAAHEACVSLCMSHWSAEGGQKTSCAPAQKNPARRRGKNDFAFLALREPPKRARTQPTGSAVRGQPCYYLRAESSV